MFDIDKIHRIFLREETWLKRKNLMKKETSQDNHLSPINIANDSVSKTKVNATEDEREMHRDSMRRNSSRHGSIAIGVDNEGLIFRYDYSKS
ncbi:unnamed protein product [Thelazia callipaeda]|uniref:Uncharacterized protein n=1 Tax=Thelazia callipaeda TaxID=103827 RepID=A0A0N5D7A6_THECL|nr:unnamed protein product [Thelazia callipaeda]